MTVNHTVLLAVSIGFKSSVVDCLVARHMDQTVKTDTYGQCLASQGTLLPLRQKLDVPVSRCAGPKSAPRNGLSTRRRCAMPVGRSDGCPLSEHHVGVMQRVRWSRPDPLNVVHVRTRGRFPFRARRSPGPRKTDCARGALYRSPSWEKIGASPTDRSHAAHSADKNEPATSDRPTLRRAQRGDFFESETSDRRTDRPSAAARSAVIF